MNHRFVQAQKLLRLAADSRFRRGIRLGVGASVEHLGMMRGRKIATLVDIGANVGQFSLLVTGLMPNVRVEAFEPLKGPAELFQKLFADNPLVTLHRVAIGSEKKDAAMNVSKRRQFLAPRHIRRADDDIPRHGESRRRNGASHDPRCGA